MGVWNTRARLVSSAACSRIAGPCKNGGKGHAKRRRAETGSPVSLWACQLQAQTAGSSPSHHAGTGYAAHPSNRYPHAILAVDSLFSSHMRSKHDLLLTGGGKSMTFQLPPLAKTNCFTVVVCPLLALASDQVCTTQKRDPHTFYCPACLS